MFKKTETPTKNWKPLANALKTKLWFLISGLKKSLVDTEQDPGENCHSAYRSCMNVFQLATLTGWCIIIAGRVENPDIASFHIVAQPAQEAENGVSAASCQAEAQFMALFHELRYYTTPNRETEKDSWRLELWMFWLCFEGGEKNYVPLHKIEILRGNVTDFILERWRNSAQSGRAKVPYGFKPRSCRDITKQW